LVTLPKNFWTRVLGSVVIQLYAGKCTPSVDQALGGVSGTSDWSEEKRKRKKKIRKKVPQLGQVGTTR